MNTNFSLCLLAGLATGLLAASCTSTSLNPNHCANNEGNAFCAERYPDGDRPFCGSGDPTCPDVTDDGCLATEPPPDCYQPCGGGITDNPPTDCLNGDGDGSSGTMSTTAGPTTMSTTGPTGPTGDATDTTGPMGCMDDDDCTNPAQPFCVVDTCETCTQTATPDQSCADLDPTLPVCAAGECVQCTIDNDAVCVGNTPICDPDANACTACTAHDQCGTDVGCNFFEGNCITDVLWVDGDQPPGGNGTQAMPFDTIGDAIAAVSAGGSMVIFIGELAAMNNYQESPTIDSSSTIVLRAWPSQEPRWQGSGANPALTVTGGGTAIVDGLQLRQSNRGVLVSNGSAWVEACAVVENSTGGIRAENGSSLVVRNSFVGQQAEQPAIDTVGGEVDLLYSTVFTNTLLDLGAFACAGGTVTIRNSIIVSRGGSLGSELDCPGATVQYTATEGAVAGPGNAAVGAFPAATPEDWFVDYQAGDYHLQNDGVADFMNIAQWQDGDPIEDIDGNARPDVDGTMDYAGADVP